MPVSDSTARPNAVKIPGLVELYTTTLESHSYGPGATHAYMRAGEHFIAWSAPDSDCVEIGEASIRRFLDAHLGRCDCPGRPQRGKVTALSALRHLLAILRAADRIPLHAATGQFVEVQVVGMVKTAQVTAAHSRAIEIRLADDRSVFVEPGFDAGHLRALLAVLEARV